MFPGVMMLPSGAKVLHRSAPPSTLCLASRADTDQLRDQLDQLHFEASNTRAKANKARQRLLRLSEAAEKLRRQAAGSVQSGKENDAREMLFQKKKTMEALEKTKTRIELLDELSAKLLEAISMRERQLVGTVALDFQTETEDAAAQVRIVPPSSENSRINGSGDNELPNSDHQEPQDEKHDEPTKYERKSLQVENTNGLKKSLKGVTSYKEFLDHVDQLLDEVETELVMVVKFSASILVDEERQSNLKVQQMMDILDGVRGVRERISVIMKTSRDEMNM